MGRDKQTNKIIFTDVSSGITMRAWKEKAGHHRRSHDSEAPLSVLSALCWRPSEVSTISAQLWPENAGCRLWREVGRAFGEVLGWYPAGSALCSC